MTITRSDLPFQTCKSCGAKIVYAEAPKANGQPGETVTVPLNVVAPVYVIVDVVGREVRAERARDTFVSHFATCEGVRRDGRPKPWKNEEATRR